MALVLPNLSRRKLLGSGATLSLAGLAVLAGKAPAAYAKDTVNPQDIDVLNGILGTEHEGIAAYQLFIGRGFILKNMMTTITTIQNQHREHRDFLEAKIRHLGGTPVSAKKDSQYGEDLQISKLKNEDDAFNLAMTLELGAANAYIGMLPSTNDRELAKVAGRIAADEVMHWTTLSNQLQKPLPKHAMSFGA